MYHNYLIATPKHNVLVSIDVGDAKNTGFNDDGVIKYHGSYTLYLNKVRAATVNNLIIQEKNVVLSYRSEELT